jgi:hypothetical protein
MKFFSALILSLCFSLAAMAQDEDNSADNNMAKLKGGYYLYLQNTSSIDKVLLSHGKEWKTIFTYSDGIIYTPWLGLDADKNFMIVTSTRGSESPQMFYVYNKENGDSLFSITGFLIKTDTINNLLVFDSKDKNTGYFTVYSLNNNTSELYKEPEDNPCYCCSCWTVDELSASLLKISYLDKSVQFNRH